MKRKYLDDIGATERPDLLNPEDHRQANWAKDREIYGFDERETWDLEFSFHLWLYERLKAYVEWAAIDMDYHKFVYKDKEYTQLELINMMLERLEFSFKEAYNDWDASQYLYVHEVEEIWAIVCGAMWW